MIKQLLFKYIEKNKLRLTILGGIIGLAILMVGVHLFLDMKSLLIKKVKINEEFVVLNKRIGLLNMLSKEPSYFTKTELEEFSKVKGVASIAPFEPSRFKVMMSLDSDDENFKQIDFKTFMFFEAIPKDFIDLEEVDWSWKEGKVVPILMSSEYMKLYNLTFAGTQDLPVVSEGILKSIRFNLAIKVGDSYEQKAVGQLVGFSDRINSILVPKEFIDWGNAKFANAESKGATRIVVKTDDISSSAFRNFISDHNYDINEDKFKAGRTTAILKTVFAITSVVAIFVILLAFLGFVQYNQLLTFKSAYEIKSLNLQGYNLRKLFAPYKQFTIKNLMIMLVGATLVYILEHFIISFGLNLPGYEIDMIHTGLGLIVGIAAAFIMGFYILKQSNNQLQKIIES